MPRPTLEELRKPARVAAEECLRERGFVQSEGQWVGSIQVGSTPAALKLALPAEFPDRLPSIVIEPGKMPERVFNCDRNGVLCLAPPSGILLDATNPAGLIAESLERARAILQSTGEQRDPAAIAQEFRSYWTTTESIISICSRLTDTRVVPVLRYKRRPRAGNPEQEKTEILICDALEDGELWLQRQRHQTVLSDTAFLCALDEAILPPPFGEQWSVAELKSLVRQATRADQCASFMRWVDQHGLPCSLVLSIPTRGGDRVLIGAGVQDVKAATKKLARRGFRPSKVTATRLLAFGGTDKILPLGVDRLDEAFLVPRGGGRQDLKDKTVTVVGVGAVGSRIAENLCSAGVGTIWLVDHDVLQNANVHRHVLGVDKVGQNKALAMCELLGRRYPHLDVRARPKNVGAILGTDEDCTLGVDLVFLATGEATLELRLNQYLGQQVPRIHAWVDPFDAGGHALLAGVANGRGCLECLYTRKASTDLHNRASFVAPGQDLTRTLGGCSDRFIPFSGLAASRAATEAVRLGVATLDGGNVSILLSWYEGDDGLKAAGFYPSKRAALFLSGQRKLERQFIDPDCPVCSGWNI
jgi:molybdopterin/thiamine biosynthesis adenylyltransferase